MLLLEYPNPGLITITFDILPLLISALNLPPSPEPLLSSTIKSGIELNSIPEFDTKDDKIDPFEITTPTEPFLPFCTETSGVLSKFKANDVDPYPVPFLYK